MVHPYLRRRAGEEEVTYPHPDLKPILERTLGVPLFQEQGMKVAVTAAGFTPSEADALRRAMSSKRKQGQMQQLTGRLIDGMRRNGYDEELAQRIVNQIKAFASYGFPESHAASFALLVYVSAYLKRYHPLAFYTALLNNQPMGFYSPATIVNEARRHGIPVRPVDVTRSRWDWTIEADGLRAGLCSVRGLGETHRLEWEQARARGPWRSVEDVCARLGWSMLHLERLAAIGAFAGLGVDRREALWRVQGYRPRPGLAAPMAGERVPDLAPVGVAEALIMDMRNVGHSVEAHPIQLMRPTLDRWKVVRAHGLERVRSNQAVRVAGVVSVRQRPPTAKGFCFLTLEDETGMMNVIVRPDKYEEYRPVVRRALILLIEGTLQRQKGVLNIQAEKIAALDDRWAQGMRSRDFH
jgi:error-prone DNA polymerase